MTTDTPLGILSRRLASGEISIEEFERLKGVLDFASQPSAGATPPAEAAPAATAAPSTPAPEPAEPETTPALPAVAEPVPDARKPPPFETEAQRMLRRDREWREQQRAGTSGIVTLAAPAAAGGGAQRLPVQTAPATNGSGIKPAWLIGGGVGLGVLVLAVAASAGPTCEVSNVRTRAETMWLNGGFDAGIVVSASVTSDTSGMVNVQGLLSTSEGSFQHTRPFMLTKGQPSSVEIQFPEPTINVNLNDLQAVVQCVSS